MIKISKTKTNKASYANKEVSAANLIPFYVHLNDKTVVTKSQELFQVVKIDGFSFETADDDDLDIKKNGRNLVLKTMASGNIALFFYTLRNRKAAYGDDQNIPVDPRINVPLDFASYVEYEWRKKHKKQLGYANEHYVVVMRKPDKGGVAFFEYLVKQFQSKTDKKVWEQSLRETYDELEEAVGRITASFRDYNPEILGNYTNEHGTYSELLEFLGRLVNCGYQAPFLASATRIDHYLPTHRLYFGSKSIEVKSAHDQRFAAIISIKEYAPKTFAGVFDGFLLMPFEYIMSQSFYYSNRQIAIAKMQTQQNRMITSEDKAVSQIAEISAALDMAMSGDIAFGTHHLTITVFANNLKALEGIVSMAVVEFANCGITAVREKSNMEPAYWAALPGNISFVVRKSVINSLNLAAFASMHNYPVGKARGNHWGEAVTVFNTTSGTPYFFNFHLRDVGHSLIIGPTGAGKTVLMNFLCAQSMKFKSRMFFFDKDHGAEIFIRALNGVYSMISPAQGCGFNPLQLPETPENRTFLLDWFKLLVTTNNETLDSDDIALINSAINGNYKLRQEDRRLSNVAPFFGIQSSGSIASRLAMWHGIGSHAMVFDNDVDNLDLKNSRIFGFEMGELLRDKICLNPVLTYLFHRISISLDGTPTMIVLDEAWALIDNPVFAPKIKDWLKVLRKLNTFVIFATQSVEDASKSQISDTLIQQTATQIFLPNLKATSVYRTQFMLSEREHTLIKTTDPGSRYFLVKQGTNAVIAKLDLAGLDNIINVLSGRTETVILLNKIRAEVGDNPDDWLPIFYERVKQKNE